MYAPNPEMRWVHQWMALRLDGSGSTRIRCQKATHDYFKFDELPVPSFSNPEQPDYSNGVIPRPIRNSNVAVLRFRIAYAEWPGHKKPQMASVSVLGPWKQETFQIIHKHLIDKELPYLYLCNVHGNKISDCWSIGLRPLRTPQLA